MADARSAVSPLYETCTEYGEPEASNPPATVHDADPAASGWTFPARQPTGPSPVGVMLNVTSPDGVSAPGVRVVTFAVNVTARPATDGFAEDETEVADGTTVVTLKFAGEYTTWVWLTCDASKQVAVSCDAPDVAPVGTRIEPDQLPSAATDRSTKLTCAFEPCEKLTITTHDAAPAGAAQPSTDLTETNEPTAPNATFALNVEEPPAASAELTLQNAANTAMTSPTATRLTMFSAGTNLFIQILAELAACERGFLSATTQFMSEVSLFVAGIPLGVR